MRKTIIRVLSIIFILLICYGIFISVKEMNKPSKESIIDGKDVSKEEYLYKDDLLDIGYSVDEITSIQNKLSFSDVKAYLLNNKKYDNIISFINVPYSKISNISRYISYYNEHPDYSFEQIVLYVEIGLDNNSVKIVDNYKDTLCIVNKYNQLPEDVTYDDLVKIEKPYSSNGNEEIRSIAYDNLIKMIDDASKDNISLLVVSGFRTKNKQESLYNYNRNLFAKPLHSEHELGLSVDFNSVNNNFSNTTQYEWLKDNAYKYGFIERYQKGKELITGHNYKPWHYRYVGTSISTKIYEENITFEEYLVKYKK